jgi:hypothetical protein
MLVAVGKIISVPHQRKTAGTGAHKISENNNDNGIVHYETLAF